MYYMRVLHVHVPRRPDPRAKAHRHVKMGFSLRSETCCVINDLLSRRNRALRYSCTNVVSWAWAWVRMGMGVGMAWGRVAIFLYLWAERDCEM
ncbi:hypothetical protein BDN70DRAFT_407053 [Pholiota conissans]|uniref:Uncharacterized protein n=1 Tax=Pholiota conissans TaxID=109636 RepID=A0A9P5YQC6_9AGAR|nr:hypothetical protein BDN70DRAFT_407053 [Pholiota conissans]